MSSDTILKSHQRFSFRTKGLTKDDILQIDRIFKSYEINAVYRVGDYESKDVKSIIELCEKTSATSLHANNPIDENNSYVSLLVNGPLSSWEVYFSKDETIKDRAVGAQLFNEVEKILKARREMFPSLPWDTLRDIIVFAPIFLLAVKIIFPTLRYDYSDILRITVFSAIFSYLIGFLQIRRISRRVIIVKTPFRDRLRTARNWILVTIAASIISSVSEKTLELINKYFSQ